MSKPVLKIDWATHKAAKYACEHWHYSKSLPPPPMLYIGVWENEKFIGVVLFSRGASKNLLKPYKLEQVQGCELTRIALMNHFTPVSKIISIAIKFLKINCKRLRLIVSFADPNEGHHGGIYQASNWIYCGVTSDTKEYIGPDKKKWHARMVKNSGETVCYGKRRKVFKPSQCQVIYKKGKHRYLMPLDDTMRKQIEPLRKPYPKRAGSETKDTPSVQEGEGGSMPTPALHLNYDR